MARPLSIDLTAAIDPPTLNHAMGGVAPDGTRLAVNNRYLTKDDRPWLPAMGEVHYSRIPRDRWEVEIQKCKAGGIEIVATYSFWIHHEEQQGTFDFSDQRDLREFLRLCARQGLWVWLRIGPWAHGECRNGGFPDWLVDSGLSLRENDPGYLEHVRNFWTALHAQVAGLSFEEGGPIIGIQLENELMRQREHLRTLKQLALEIGLQAPFWTVTGWGEVELPEGEVLPVFGGYADGFWERSTDDWPLRYRKNFFFRHTRNDTTIGNDLNPSDHDSEPVDPSKVPYLTCETGGGMPSSYHRRICLAPMDTVALAYVMVGSGSNLQGYYMYHGGTNPVGKLSSQQESQDTGYPNDVPVKAYFPDSPIGDFGQLNPTFHPLRALHRFLADFGETLAPCVSVLPADLPADLKDVRTLRWAVRHDGRSGFLFVNNHQRHEQLSNHEAIQFELHFPEGPLVAPSVPIDVPAGSCFILPVRLNLDGIELSFATVQPVSIVRDGLSTTFTFTAIKGIAPSFYVAAEVDALIGAEGAEVLPDPLGLRIAPKDDASEIHIRFLADGRSINIVLAPTVDATSGVQLVCGVDGAPAAVDVRQVRSAECLPSGHLGPAGVAQAPSEEDWDRAAIYAILLPQGVPADYIEVRYVGAVARIYRGGQLLTDNFFNGAPWLVGVASADDRYEIRILPFDLEAPIYLEPSVRQSLENHPHSLCELLGVQLLRSSFPADPDK